MHSLSTVFPSIFLLATAASATVTAQVAPPALGGKFIASNALNLTDTQTDTTTIVQTAAIIDQKSGPSVDAPPNEPIPETAVIAVDGQVTDAGTPSRRSLPRHTMQKRSPSDYKVVFNGTGTGPDDRDASIEGTAYLTYTVVPNSTHSVDSCLDFCDRVQGCVFVNLYYEFNNELLDFVFSEKSNLKCAAYADVHSAAEKTNFGGQQSYPSPGPLTYIQQSSGYAAKSLVEPDVPGGYDFVFGPTGGANNAPGYMGFTFIDRYDVDACAHLCNSREADSNGGVCQYFNIWRAVVNGVPTTYTCAFYFIPADVSTAVNFGQGDLVVTLSRGYRRKNYVIDGGFEGFQCSSEFCFTTSYSNWVGTSDGLGVLDASIFHQISYAHAGAGSALLGSADGSDSLSGTLTPTQPLETVAGKDYTITLFSSSAYSGPSVEANAFWSILWNGNIVQTVHPGFSDYTFYSFNVQAAGDDVLALHGGSAAAWSFFDDISVFEI